MVMWGTMVMWDTMVMWEMMVMAMEIAMMLMWEMLMTKLWRLGESKVSTKTKTETETRQRLSFYEILCRLGVTSICLPSGFDLSKLTLPCSQISARLSTFSTMVVL